MKVFTAAQIREGDAFTMANEPVKSIDLMERAAAKCADWLLNTMDASLPFYLFCGTGNNGGDGLAIARMLKKQGRETQVYMVMYSGKISDDCHINKQRLEENAADILHFIDKKEDWPALPENAIIIDALFGTGINRALEGLAKYIVNKINTLSNKIIAIDMPSGLRAEKNEPEAAIVKADFTLSFEWYKLAFLFPENTAYTGRIHILPIGIHPTYIQQTKTPYQLITKEFVKKNYIRRNSFSHKGTFGHALIVAGSYGKTGAAILATKAALHGGAGLVTAYVPKGCYAIMQISVPEAMCICDPQSDHLSTYSSELNKFNTIGIGPGIGTCEATHHFLRTLLSHKSAPMVLDADALNLISKDSSLPEWMNKEKNLRYAIPKNSILTPHPKEFERLFGKTSNDYERLQLQIEKSKTLQLIIVLKGHHTCITTPSGEAWFNTTGNAGMATGGSGDVLTGIITALLAQGYKPDMAAIIGVWLHGKAGDEALSSTSMESLTASEIINHLGRAFKTAHNSEKTDNT